MICYSCGSEEWVILGGRSDGKWIVECDGCHARWLTEAL